MLEAPEFLAFLQRSLHVHLKRVKLRSPDDEDLHKRKAAQLLVRSQAAFV
jgi:hypothetical protein